MSVQVRKYIRTSIYSTSKMSGTVQVVGYSTGRRNTVPYSLTYSHEVQVKQYKYKKYSTSSTRDSTSTVFIILFKRKTSNKVQVQIVRYSTSSTHRTVQAKKYSFLFARSRIAKEASVFLFFKLLPKVVLTT